MTATDAGLARQLATDAGRLLLRIRAAETDATTARDRGDRESSDWLVQQLRQHRPTDVVVSEEQQDDPARLRADRVWIVDPLDGTREFGEPNRVDWAVHVALWQGGELTAGAVALPALGETYASDEALVVPRHVERVPRIAVSRTRPPQLVHRVAEQLGAELVPMGSAGAKVLAVLRGFADVYVHAGGQYEWDSAAPIVLARAAGLHTARLDGSRLTYNNPELWLPDLVVCRPGLARDVHTALE